MSRSVPETMLPAIHGPAWGYRHRCRLSARHVVKKGRVPVGFREKRSSYVAEMTSCELLPPRLSRLLVPPREPLGGLSIYTCAPQVEVSVGEDVLVLVVRILAPLSQQDEKLLRQ